MARNFKTPKKARTTYKVYDAYDRVVAEFVPGQGGVTEILIQQLHAADDDEFDANRRESYHIPVHYMAYTSGDAEEAEDRNSYLADEAADPSIILEKAISRAEFKRAFHERWSRLTKEQQRLVVRKASGETNVAIAAEQAMLAFMNQQYPLTSWSAFQPDRPESDFRDLPAGDVLMKVALHQIDTLTEICKRCTEDPEHAAEYRLEAFESCPGLTELWPQPFQAKYNAADGAVLVRFKTDLGGTLHMAIDTVAK